MKLLKFMCMMTALLLAPAALASMVTVPTLAYVSSSGGTGHDVRMTLEGIYPETCFKNGKDSFTIDPVARRIFVISRAVRIPGPCLLGFVGYVKTIDLGRMRAGDYELIFIGPNKEPHPMGFLRLSGR